MNLEIFTFQAANLKHFSSICITTHHQPSNMFCRSKNLLWHKHILPTLFFSLIFIGLLQSSLNFHTSSDTPPWRQTIFADAGGYYHFLPTTFYAHFNPDSIAKDAEKKSGKGFTVSQGKIISKYPYGVALLQLPFFGAAHIYASATNQATDGYSSPYFRMISWSGSFYAVAGLFFLFHFLKREFHFKSYWNYLGILLIALGTNFFYYTVYNPGFSHTYSFFLFALFLYLIQYWRIIDFSINMKLIFLLGFTSGMIFIVRHINILFVCVVFLFYHIDSPASFKQRLLHLLKLDFWKRFTPFFFIPIIPQLVYNKYAFGSYFSHGYTNESFHFDNPQFQYHLFDSLNGTFIYTPILIIAFIGLIYLCCSQHKIWRWMLPFFILLVYINSSWHCWWFGCGFGMRVYIEYCSLLIIPILFIAQKIKVKAFSLVFSAAIVFNLFMSNEWKGCFNGEKHVYKDLLEIVAQAFQQVSL